MSRTFGKILKTLEELKKKTSLTVFRIYERHYQSKAVMGTLD